jgi:hypothetical protein
LSYTALFRAACTFDHSVSWAAPFTFPLDKSAGFE